jgi:hypothetical protein
VVCRQTGEACALEQPALCLAQDDRDLRHPMRQALAGAQEERNAPPACVLDPDPHRHERLDGRVRRDAFLVPVAGHLVPLDDAGGVLTPDELVRGERAYGLKQLRLAVANVLWVKRVGRLHRHEREHLEQVVLDHVAERPGLLVVAAAPLSLPRPAPHFASHLIIDLGLDPAQVSRILGHMRITITLDIYTYLFEDARHARDIRTRMAASPFAGLLEPAKAAPGATVLKLHT